MNHRSGLRRSVELGLLAMFLVGPAIHYGASVLIYCMGAVSIAALTSCASQSILTGAIAGGLAVGFTRGRSIDPWRTANRTGLVALVLWAVPFFVIGGITGRLGMHEVEIVVVQAAAAWLTGYVAVTAARSLFARDWQGA